MAGIIQEPYWKKLWRKIKIAELEKKLKSANSNGDTASAALYEKEIAKLRLEDHVIH